MGLEGYEGFVVIGAGPAGAVFTYLASRKLNVDVVVYEMLGKPGLKACGWGLIRSVEEYVGAVPRKYVLNKIKGFKIYVDNVEVVKYVSHRTFAYMIDRPGLMEYYASYGRLRLGEKTHLERILRDYPRYLPVIASGYMWRTRLRRLILGVEYLVDNVRIDEPEYFEVYTWLGFAGYLWVFPFSDRVAHVGIGGVAGYNELVERLNLFIGSDPRFRGSRIRSRLVGYVSIDGVREEYIDSTYPVIGEAMGAVLPLTGEGMRPSMVSAWSLVEALRRGNWRSYVDLFKRTGIPRLISLQQKMFNYIEGKRARFNVNKLRELIRDCEWIVYEIAFGNPSWYTILKTIPCGIRRAMVIAGLLKRCIG